MKVCYIFRPKEKNVYSIENVFMTIVDHIGKYGVEPSLYFSNISIWRTIKELRKLKADLYHITGDVHYLALFLPPRKTIITIHDIGHYKNNKRSLKFYLYALFWFILPIWWVKKITTISESTKIDLIKYFRINPNKITLIANPLSMPLIPFPKVFNLEKPIILQIGSGWYKNLSRLIDAVENIPCQLDIIGNPPLDLIEKMKLYQIEYRTTYRISEEELIEKYKMCDIVFFASVGEGFGLPVLEAQAIGRPLITSNISPLKEIAGDGALLVDPFSVDEIHEAILRLMNDSELVQSIVDNGFKNVEKYTPDKIAEDYWNFYQTII